MAANTSAETRVQLSSLKHIENVNALEKDQKIKFHPNMTICFGENASGKTSYVRILKNAANTRTADKDQMKKNIYDSKSNGSSQQAEIEFFVNKHKYQELWRGEQNIKLLNQIDVFDSHTAGVHLKSEIGYSYMPAELSLFLLVREDAINRVQEKFQNYKLKSNSELNFSMSNYPSNKCQLYQDIKKFGKTINLQELNTFLRDFESFSKISSEEEAELSRLRRSVEVLRSNSVPTQIIQARREEELFVNVLKVADTVIKFDHEIYATALSNLRTARDKHKQATKSALAYEDVPGIFGEAWRAFIEKGEEYIKETGIDSYPTSEHRCIYCQQPLKDAAVTLLRKYRAYCNDSFRQAVNQSHDQLKILCKNICELPIDKIKDDIVSLANVLRDSSRRAPIKKAQDIVSYAQILQKALKQEENYPSLLLNFQELMAIVERAKEATQSTITDLNNNSEERDKTLTIKQERLWNLEARVMLSKLMPEIKKHIKVVELMGKFHSIKSNLTAKAKEASDLMINRKFKERFLEECTAFRAPEIRLEFFGREGQSLRRKILTPGNNLDEILSEGEQKIIALADFLAEVSLKPKHSPVVFDDPVTSLDYKRISYIVERLVDLSKERQVIVFTHDVWLAVEIFSLFGENVEECRIEKIRSVEKKIGKVDNNVKNIRTDTFNDRKMMINDIIKRAQTQNKIGNCSDELIVQGYEILRGTCEVIVEQKLLNDVIGRYRPNVSMGRLKDIKVKQFSKARLNITQIFNKCNRKIRSHSQPLPTQEIRPTLDEFCNDWETIQRALTEYTSNPTC